MAFANTSSALRHLKQLGALYLKWDVRFLIENLRKANNIFYLNRWTDNEECMKQCKNSMLKSLPNPMVITLGDMQLYSPSRTISIWMGKKKKRGKKRGKRKEKRKWEGESMGHTSFNYSVVGLKYLMEMTFWFNGTTSASLFNVLLHQISSMSYLCCHYNVIKYNQINRLSRKNLTFNLFYM